MASLTRNQYYSNQDLQNLFSRLGIKAEEVISQEFDDILKLVERRYRKLALKFHPDKNKGNEEQAKKKFQELTDNKRKLEQHLNALRSGRTPGRPTTLQEEIAEKQRKVDEILSRRSEAINGALLFFVLANVVFTPSLKVEYCLSQLANSGTVQSIAYQFYAFSIEIWPLLFIISFCGVIYAASKQQGLQEENSDKYNRRVNMLLTADNYVICIAATFAICGLVSEVAQNGWPAQYGTMLMINLA